MPGRTPMTLFAAFRIARTSGDPSWVLRAIIAGLTNILGPLWHALRPLVSRAPWLLKTAAHAIRTIVRVIGKAAWWILTKFGALVSNIWKGVAAVTSKVFGVISGLGLPGILFLGTTIVTIVLYIRYPQQVINFAFLVLRHLKQGFELGKAKTKEPWESDMGQKVAHVVSAASDALPGALRKVQGAVKGV